MITVGVTEFRTNIKKYLDIANQEKVIIHKGNGMSYIVIPVTEVADSPYNPEFVKEILRGREDYKLGKTVSISLDDLWK